MWFTLALDVLSQSKPKKENFLYFIKQALKLKMYGSSTSSICHITRTNSFWIYWLKTIEQENLPASETQVNIVKLFSPREEKQKTTNKKKMMKKISTLFIPILKLNIKSRVKSFVADFSPRHYSLIRRLVWLCRTSLLVWIQKRFYFQGMKRRTNFVRSPSHSPPFSVFFFYQLYSSHHFMSSEQKYTFLFTHLLCVGVFYVCLFYVF